MVLVPLELWFTSNIFFAPGNIPLSLITGKRNRGRRTQGQPQPDDGKSKELREMDTLYEQIIEVSILTSIRNYDDTHGMCKFFLFLCFFSSAGN